MRLRKDTQILQSYSLIMSKKLMISMLERGQTGNEILMILDAITQTESSDTEPTLDEIDF